MALIFVCFLTQNVILLQSSSTWWFLTVCFRCGNDYVSLPSITLDHHHHHHQKNWNWRNWRARGGRERRMPDQLEPSNLTQWVVGDLSLIVFSCWLDGGRGPSICHLLVVVDAVLCWSQKCGSPFPLGLTYIVLCIIICTCNHNKVHGLSVFVW